jgi:hypothetical protein
MAIYFFVIISLIIIGLLIFAFSESKGKNSPNARSKPESPEHIIETSSPPAQNSSDFTAIHGNH